MISGHFFLNRQPFIPFNFSKQKRQQTNKQTKFDYGLSRICISCFNIIKQLGGQFFRKFHLGGDFTFHPYFLVKVCQQQFTTLKPAMQLLTGYTRSTKSRLKNSNTHTIKNTVQTHSTKTTRNILSTRPVFMATTKISLLRINRIN